MNARKGEGGGKEGKEEREECGWTEEEERGIA